MNSHNDAGPLLEFLTPLQKFLSDDQVTEICVNRPNEVVTEGRHGWQQHEVKLSYEYCHQLAVLIATYGNQRVSETEPVLSGTLPGGERIQIVMPPACLPGHISMTIRRPSTVRLTIEDYEKAGAFKETADYSAELAPHEKELLQLKEQRRFREFLHLAVQTKQNIIVSGATGSGKTTFMKSLIGLVPDDERLVSIENVDELALRKTHSNTVALFYSAGGQGMAKVNQKDLLESSLRMKPDRIFLAELIRGDEAFYFLRNVNSGHPGSITSMHANSARLAIEQLVLFIKESASGNTMSRDDIKELLTMCIDVIVQIKNLGGKRVVTEIYYDPISKRRKVAN